MYNNTLYSRGVCEFINHLRILLLLSVSEPVLDLDDHVVVLVFRAGRPCSTKALGNCCCLAAKHIIFN